MEFMMSCCEVFQCFPFFFGKIWSQVVCHVDLVRASVIWSKVPSVNGN